MRPIECNSLHLFALFVLFSVFLSSMNEVVHTSPTIGSNVEEIVVNNTHFLMWDIGGQESLRSSWNTYYTNTEVGRSACVDASMRAHCFRIFCDYLLGVGKGNKSFL